MEESMTLFTESLDQTFGLSEKDWKMYSPLTLAYLGDAAYEFMIRTIFVKRANCQPQKLHYRVIECVSAKAQAQMIEALQPFLTEEEAGIYRRGRNSKPYTKARNASMREYLEATGFEAIMGYLCLQRRYARMCELTARGLAALGILPMRTKAHMPRPTEREKAENGEPDEGQSK